MKIDVDDPLYEKLRGIEDRIKAGAGKSVVDRWEFGRALLQHRDGKQLRTGVLTAVAKEYGISRSEVGHRMRFAEKFTEDEVANAVSDFGSWRRIVSEALRKRETKPKDWGERASARLDKLIGEAGESDERHAALVALLQTALSTLAGGQEVAA